MSILSFLVAVPATQAAATNAVDREYQFWLFTRSPPRWMVVSKYGIVQFVGMIVPIQWGNVGEHMTFVRANDRDFFSSTRVSGVYF